MGGDLQRCARGMIDPYLVKRVLACVGQGVVWVSLLTYSCARGGVLKAKPLGFVPRKHPFGEQSSERGGHYDAGKAQ